MNENKIIEMLLKHDNDIEWIKENMATKADVRNISDGVDVLVKLAKKKDEELTFMGERVKRIEHDVQKLKTVSGIA